MERKAGIITGASSGIGRAVAVEMAKHGYDLALIARRSDRLNELKILIEQKYSGRVIINSCDVRNTEEMENIIQNSIEEMGKINVVIVNAGYTIPGSFDSLKVDDYKNIFNTNFFGMLNTLYPALSSLKENSGTIVIVGSILGELGILDRSAYSTTKFAQRGFYESVRYELKEKNISLILVEPGFVKTELRYMDRKGNRIEVVTDEVRKKTSHSISVMPEVVAIQIVRMLDRRGYRKKIITGHAKLFAFLNWLCPALISSFVYRNRDFIRKKVIK